MLLLDKNETSYSGVVLLWISCVANLFLLCIHQKYEVDLKYNVLDARTVEEVWTVM